MRRRRKPRTSPSPINQRHTSLNRRCLDMVGNDPLVAEVAERPADNSKVAEDQAFADKLAKRPPPDPVERAEIEKARTRTKARAPRIAMHIEDRGKAGSVVYPAHSDDEGHDYRLADAFGTRSRQFVYSM